VTNALNMPSISAEDAPRLKPYLALGAQLGEFAGQITDHAIQGIEIEYEGTVTDINTDPITSVIIAHLLGAQTESINMVNALKVAEARGIKIKQSYDKTGRNWRSMINLIVKTTKRTRNVTGTLFTGKEPRVVNIEGVPVEAALTRDMLFIRNKDKPGLIGGLGMILADGGQNIADFRLGRVKAGETAVCLVSLDAPLPDDLFEKVEALPQIESVKRLRF
jgi:D-3-phosphoglycerate dehydrogenase